MTFPYSALRETDTTVFAAGAVAQSDITMICAAIIAIARVAVVLFREFRDGDPRKDNARSRTPSNGPPERR